MSSINRLAALGVGCALAAAFCYSPIVKAESLERVEISAPIFPNVLIMYNEQGSKYPTDFAGQKDLAHRSALTFEFLLEDCAKDPRYNAIVLSKNGETLTPEQLAKNYSLVADCAYIKYTAKPYWIPQLLADVDICDMELGTGWRMINEADILSLRDEERKFIADTLSPSVFLTTGDDFGPMYFSLRVFVRATDGTIKSAYLGPGSANIQPLFASSENLKNHYEGELGLRCIRMSNVFSENDE
jgi:hypothetical protein